MKLFIPFQKNINSVLVPLLLVLFFFQISSNAFGIISKEKKPCYLNSSDLNRNLINSEAEKTTFEVHRFWLNLSKENTVVGQTLLGYVTGATLGVDSNFDSPYFNDSPVALVSIIENNEYIIQARGVPFLNTDVVQLGFKTSISGNYTITLSNFDGLFLGNQAIFLKDKVTGILHNLKNSAYTFTSGIGVFYQRFEIHYLGDTTTYENGVWDFGFPTENMNAIIKSDFNIQPTSFFSSKSLTVSSGVFTVKSGATLSVEKSIKNNSGVHSFIIENDGIVLQNSSELNQGMFTVIRDSNPLYRYDYTLWSSPVIGQNLRDFSPSTLFNRFYSYNTIEGSNGDYQQELTTTADVINKVFESGKGYLIRMPNNWNENILDEAVAYNGTFKGVLQNGSLNVPLSLANSKLNLVGNPYPSPISINAFFNANPNLEHILYFWRKTNGTPGSGYITYTSLGTNTGVSIANIQTGQGFFVKSNTATSLNFNNSMRVFSDESPFFKSSINVVLPQIHRFWLKLSKDSEEVGSALIGYTENATDLVDNGIDAIYFNDNPLALNSLIENNEYIIQGKGLPFLNTDTVKLGFKTPIGGEFKIELSNFEGLFQANQDIFLKDNVTNIVHDLKSTAYNFSSTEGVFKERFEIQYLNTLDLKHASFLANSIIISIENEHIKIISGIDLINQIEVIDLMGREIYKLKNIDSSFLILENFNATKQVLLLKIKTKKNGTVTKKIIF